MRITITGGAGRLGQTLAVRWQATHQVRTVDTVPLPASAPSQEHLVGDLRDPAFAAQAATDAAAVVHLAPIAPADSTSDLDRLDDATRGTYHLLLAAAESGVQTVVLGSTLDLFAAYPGAWHVTEQWVPRPAPTLEHLAPYLAECSARELARVLPLRIVGLRLGEIVDESDIAGQPFDGRWLHLDDAVQAVERAVTGGSHATSAPDRAPVVRQAVPVTEKGDPATGWWVFHIPAAGPRTRVPLVAAGETPLGYAPLGYAPQHDFRDHWTDDWQHPPAAPPLPAVPSRPIRKVVVFGAGGPLAAATAPLLAETHTVRLTDLRPLADIIAEGKPQSEGAPLPTILGPPHETRAVDVTDYDQVLAACDGMDAIVNCTVFRPESERAFKVNCLGAYNVMRAAVAQRIRRVVHTGPQMVMQEPLVGYRWNADVQSDVPMRPGAMVYLHSKYLGEEVVRTFAEAYELEVPTFYFNHFANPTTIRASSEGIDAFTVSWNDAALALRRGLEVPSLPQPFEIFLISADLPHGYVSNEKAKRLLGWQPRDRFEHRWVRLD